MNAKLIAGLAAGAAVAALAGPAAAQNFVPKEKGTFIVNIRASSVDPDDGAPILTVAGGVDTGLDARVDSDLMPTLGFTYFLTDSVAVEVIAGTTEHQINASALPVANAWVIPPVVTLQYHFNGDQKISPYIGAGLNYMIFYNEDNIAPFTDFHIKNGLGYAFQLGVDVALQGPWALNVDVKQVIFDTTVNTTLPGTGDLITDVDLDPMVISVGLGRRW